MASCRCSTESHRVTGFILSIRGSRAPELRWGDVRGPFDLNIKTSYGGKGVKVEFSLFAIKDRKAEGAEVAPFSSDNLRPSCTTTRVLLYANESSELALR